MSEVTTQIDHAEISEQLLALTVYPSGEAPKTELQEFLDAFHASDDYRGRDIYDNWYGISDSLNLPIYVPRHKSVDWLIDRALGYEPEQVEVTVSQRETELRRQHPGEKLWFGGKVWTDYYLLRSAVKGLNLTANDTLYDLGSGYGRLPLYAGFVTDAQTRGIEVVDERVQTALLVRDRWELETVDFSCANVLDTDFSDGTAFYMYAPFSDSTDLKVFSQLEVIHEQHPIRVALRGGCVAIHYQQWLNNIGTVPKAGAMLKSIRLYESRNA